ncbi:hypothetical protein GCM10009839_14200 [Catenulispora yoronensis]|uniref:Uncharacterized protein n=1 Tax=Catenulispora yoronensis TaxID=450799 RepID=A0ABP5F9Z8_9ACTN
MRLWFRRRKNRTTQTSTTEFSATEFSIATTIKGDMTMAAFTKAPQFALAADVQAAGIYQTARRAQGYLDDIDSLIEVVRLQSRKLNGVLIEGKRSPLSIVAAAEGSEDLATELEDLFDDMAAGYGRTVKRPAKGKASADPTTRLDTVVETAEAMRNAVLFLLGTALKVAFESNAKQIKTALSGNEVPSSLIESLISAPQDLAPVAEEEPEPEPVVEPKVLVRTKPINHTPVNTVAVEA